MRRPSPRRAAARQRDHQALAEEAVEPHLALWAVLSAPTPPAALDGAAQAIPVVVGMAQPNLVEQRDRPQSRAADQERQDVGLPQPAERVDGLSPQRSLGGLLGWQPRVVLDAAAGALAQSAHGGGGALGVVTAGLHVQPHLLVGGGASGHVGLARCRGTTLPTRTPRPEAGVETRAPVGSPHGRATPSLRPTQPAILRVAHRPTLLLRNTVMIARSALLCVEAGAAVAQRQGQRLPA